MVCLMLRPLRLWGSIHLRYWIRGWMVPRAGLDSDTLRLPGIELRLFGGPASGLAANVKLQSSILAPLWVWNEFKIKEYHWEEIWICYLVFYLIHICCTLSWNTSDSFCVQGVSRGKSIFWEVIISVTMRTKAHMKKCLIPSGYRDRAVWIYKYKITVNGNKVREITYC